MIFVVYLLLLAILLGMGALVASMLPTRGARIGLGTAVFLALIIDCTWFVAPLLGWSLTLVDVVWGGVFALVVLGAAMMASYHSGLTDQSKWAWPSTRDLMFFFVVIISLGTVIWFVPVPLDTDAQGFGYLSLMLREGGDYTTLAPWHAEIDYLYSPGYIGLIAHLSARFDVGIHLLQLIMSVAIAVVFIWLAYDLGCELEGPRTGRSFMLASIIGTGLITAFMDSHFTALLALLFALAFITFIVRLLESWRWSSVFFAAVCLAGVPLSQPDTTIALIIGYVPWLLFIWLSRPRPKLSIWLGLAVVIPLMALIIVAPWLLSLDDLLNSNIESPFQIETTHWRTLAIMHGGVIVLLAGIGALMGLWRRLPVAWWMVIWLVGIVEFSAVGLLEQTFPDQLAPLLKYDYPFSLAWHGPIIPYSVLGGLALVWLVDKFDRARIDHIVAQWALPVLTLVSLALIAGMVLFDPLLDTSKDYIHFFGAFSSEADVDAMRWLRDNTPENARILNHPGPHEGDWVPIIAERDTIFFRPQPFFQNSQSAQAEQNALRAFWEDPTNPDHAALLRTAGVRYVLVPQVFGNPTSLENMLRWREPLAEAAAYQHPTVETAPYLRLVYDQQGAQVYEVIGAP